MHFNFSKEENEQKIGPSLNTRCIKYIFHIIIL